jgi:hypothetical protein
MVSRRRCVPFWMEDDLQQVVEFENSSRDAQLFWSRLSPLVEKFLRRSRRTALSFNRLRFGVLADLLVGKSNDLYSLVAIHCKPIPFALRPCEWSIFVAVMIVSTPSPDQRTSFVLLTALEIESLQLAEHDVFSMSRIGVASEELFTPSQCFGEIWKKRELLRESSASFVVSRQLVHLVEELRRIKCFKFDACVSTAGPLLLQYLHVIIMSAGLGGLVVLTRAHDCLLEDELFRFYENFHWIVRSARFLSYFQLAAPSFVVLNGELDEWVRSLQTKIDRGVNAPVYDKLFAFDGVVAEGGSCSLSLQDLINRLEHEATATGRAAVVHSYLQGVECGLVFCLVFYNKNIGGLVMQCEDGGLDIQFKDITLYLEVQTKQHSCSHARCSVQIRWTLSLEECCNDRGRRFCHKLFLLGLHPFLQTDLVQRSVGWIEGAETGQEKLYFGCYDDFFFRVFCAVFHVSGARNVCGAYRARGHGRVRRFAARRKRRN